MHQQHRTQGPEQKQKSRLRHNLKGPWMPAEGEIVSGRHPKILALRSPRVCHSVYLSMCWLCVELKTDNVPEVFCILNNLAAKLGMGDEPRRLEQILRELSGNSLGNPLISTGELRGNPRRFAYIHVVGLRDKLRHLSFSACGVMSNELIVTSTDIKNMSVDVGGDADQNPNCPHTGQTELGGTLGGTSRFEAVFEVLRTIPLREYQGVTADSRWERDFADTLGAGRDVAWLVSEAKRFRLWIEEQLEFGKEPPNKKHRPRQRFCGQWLPRAVRENRANGSDHTERPKSLAWQLAEQAGVR